MQLLSATVSIDKKNSFTDKIGLMLHFEAADGGSKYMMTCLNEWGGHYSTAKALRGLADAIDLEKWGEIKDVKNVSDTDSS